MTLRSLLFVTATVPLFACTETPVPPPEPPLLVEPCGAMPLLALIGQPVTALPTTGLPPAVRIIRPGDPVTEDYSETRLNVELDGQDRITRVYCG